MANRSMGRNVSSVGMMEGAFFVSRTELLEWVNGLLAVKLPKVEDCASGAIYCQIVDSCHPGTVKMSKVNWMARADHEYIPNFKLLQASFDRHNIEKHIDVDKLIRAKYQDNLEFLQWMKAMWEAHGAGIEDYDPVKAREGRPVPAWAKPGATDVIRKAARGAARADAVPCEIKRGAARADAATGEKENTSMNREQAGAQKFDPSARRRPITPTAKVAPQRGAFARPTTTKDDARDLRQKLEEVMEENAELQRFSTSLEEERDYYWRKLRNVEIVCTTLEEKMDPTLDVAGVIQKISGILYQEKDEDEENMELAAQQRMEAEDEPSVQPADLSADQGVAVA